MPVNTVANPAKVFFCQALLTRSGWLNSAYVQVDAHGIILDITTYSAKVDEMIQGAMLPGFQNCHSHAFQYAMAGLTEHLPGAAQNDDFWSWRQKMYALANRVSPQQLESIAAMLYAEMLRHGYTAVAEFHYLHHDFNGQPYAQLDLMSQRLMAAAATAGIRLTLIPIFYQQGGFGQPAKPEQKRFISAQASAYQKLQEQIAKTATGYTDVLVGHGFHSLRAVQVDDLLSVLAAKPQGPIHIHAAEQPQEVTQALSYLHARPIDWLLDHTAMDQRFSIVHATHLTTAEVKRLSASQAVVIICPSTEANLGDGFFALQTYAGDNGRYTIGTDSHISLSPLEELRWLDYGQRLLLQKRNTLCRNAGDDSGALLIDQTWRGAKQAMGLTMSDYFTVGEPFDGICLDLEHASLLGKPQRHWLATAVYSGDVSLWHSVWRRGSCLVRRGVHKKYDTIKSDFRKAMLELMED